MDRIAQIKEMLKNSPQDRFLQHALALEYLKAGEVAAARAAFLTNLNADPDYLATYYHIGKLEEKEGNTDEAIRYFEQGMAIAKKQNDQHAGSELRSAYEALVF